MDNYRELKIRCDPGVGHLRPDDTKIRSKKQQNWLFCNLVENDSLDERILLGSVGL